MGLLVFGVTLFIAVVSGATNLPTWACVFNVVPMFLVLMPLRILRNGSAPFFLLFENKTPDERYITCIRSLFCLIGNCALAAQP